MNTNTKTPNEIFLQQFHKENPGCTPTSFASGFTLDGFNSYDHLSKLVQNSIKIPITVLDLACGDGTLTSELTLLNIPEMTLIGIDMSLGELELARSRSYSQPVNFIEAKAQTLPIVETSIDFILCHMAFMLMDNVEQVVLEIKRCLKPNGVFSAIIGGKFERTSLFDIFIPLLDNALKEEGKSWLSSLGDPRTRSEDGLVSLFDQNYFKDFEIKDFKINFHETPEKLINFFILMYDVGLLSEQSQKNLHKELLLSLKSIAEADGRIKHSMALRQITCKRI